MKILCIVGARPNFIKIAPLQRAFLAYPGIESKIVHTGQHYDAVMSDIFFRQLALPKPDYYLGVQAGTTTQQTADILHKFEKVLTIERPDWVLVVGDVTSTLACTLAAVQHGVRVAHVEAGLRSGDRQMPEECNRLVTDALADLLFVTEQAGVENLQREGISAEKIHFVGNVMIDSLVEYLPSARKLNTLAELGLGAGSYGLITLHRPSNVDTENGLRTLLMLIENVAHLRRVLFPMHPRTRANAVRLGLYKKLEAIPNVQILEPQGYLEFLNLMRQATFVITDSGGIQEETTYLKVPCLTFRESTERPVTVALGTNQLIADLKPETARQYVIDILSGQLKTGQIPPLWDGQTARHIAKIMYEAT
ncbi:non-hydrolyzing UDP-N-acetylglucosamine 2-epimerase [Spirosoma litoris]